MIDAYTWTTPNGQKVLIALEEMNLPYELHWVNIGKGEQMKPEFLAISPNNRIPAIVDREGPEARPFAVFESGAILLYLADKTGQFLAKSGVDRYTALEWAFFQVGGTGPMFGQLAHFVKLAPEKIPYAIDRYKKEAERLLGVMDKRLGAARFLAGEYSIADMMNLQWTKAAKNFDIALDDYAHVSRWIGEVDARPAVQKAIALKPPEQS